MTHDIGSLEQKLRSFSDRLSRLHDKKHGDQLLSIIHRPGWTSKAEFALVQAHVDHLEQQALLLDQTLDALTDSAEKIGYLSPEAAIAVSEEEMARAITTTAAALDLINARALIAGSNPDDETKARLLARSEEAWPRFDVSFLGDLANRLGEDALRAGMQASTPPNVRDALQALIDHEGGALPLVKNRINRIRSAPDTTFHVLMSDDGMGCALGAGAIVGGCIAKGVLGGFAVVVGIVMMAKYCPRLM